MEQCANRERYCDVRPPARVPTPNTSASSLPRCSTIGYLRRSPPAVWLVRFASNGFPTASNSAPRRHASVSISPTVFSDSSKKLASRLPSAPSTPSAVAALTMVSGSCSAVLSAYLDPVQGRTTQGRRRVRFSLAPWTYSPSWVSGHFRRYRFGHGRHLEGMHQSRRIRRGVACSRRTLAVSRCRSAV